MITYPPKVGPCCRLALLARTSPGVSLLIAASSSVAPGVPGMPCFSGALPKTLQVKTQGGHKTEIHSRISVIRIGLAVVSVRMIGMSSGVEAGIAQRAAAVDGAGGATHVAALHFDTHARPTTRHAAAHEAAHGRVQAAQTVRTV